MSKSKIRVCGDACHYAKGPDCDCWCQGIFHGEGGKESREVFAKEYGAEPADQRKWSSRFRSALDAAAAVGGSKNG